MKLKLFAILMGVVALALNVNGQSSFTFLNQLRDTIHFDISKGDVTKHFLGDYIAGKYFRLQETYTYVEPGNINNPTPRTVVMKPTIYYSLKKLNAHYKKQLKKGEIGSSEAIQELGWCFDVGFSIYDQNTDDFEFQRRNYSKIKFIQCKECKYDSMCEGPWNEYPLIKGDKEFVPVEKR